MSHKIQSKTNKVQFILSFKLFYMYMYNTTFYNAILNLYNLITSFQLMQGTEAAKQDPN